MEGKKIDTRTDPKIRIKDIYIKYEMSINNVLVQYYLKKKKENQ